MSASITKFVGSQGVAIYVGDRRLTKEDVDVLRYAARAGLFFAREVRGTRRLIDLDLLAKYGDQCRINQRGYDTLRMIDVEVAR